MSLTPVQTCSRERLLLRLKRDAYGLRHSDALRRRHAAEDESGATAAASVPLAVVPATGSRCFSTEIMESSTRIFEPLKTDSRPR